MVRAGKIWADGLVRMHKYTRSEALEITAKRFGYTDWNRMVADAPRLEFRPIKDGHPRKDIGKIIATGSGDDGIKAMAASIIRAYDIWPRMIPGVMIPLKSEYLIDNLEYNAEMSRKYQVIPILRAPGTDENVPSWMGEAWAHAVNNGFLKNFSFAVRVSNGEAEAFGPDLAAHSYILNSIPGKNSGILKNLFEGFQDPGLEPKRPWSFGTEFIHLNMAPPGRGKAVRLKGLPPGDHIPGSDFPSDL